MTTRLPTLILASGAIAVAALTTALALATGGPEHPSVEACAHAQADQLRTAGLMDDDIPQCRGLTEDQNADAERKALIAATDDQP